MRGFVAILFLLPTFALAFEEPTRRTEVDAGVHVPVLTKAPALTQFVEAQYPPEAQQAGLAGSVRMLVTIGADGGVDDVQVTAPAGHGFDENAVAAVRRFSFTPAEVDFTPAAVQIEYVYHFALKVIDAGVVFDGGVDGGSFADVPAHLTGTLIVRGGRTRIRGGLIRCANHEVEAVSDEQGKFDLTVPPGECKVKVIAADSQPYETTETLKPGETAEVNYYVRPKVIGFETVVRAPREKKEVVRRTLTREELQKVPGSFGDPVRVIQNFPGVARAPFISGQIIVRGANPNQTLTYFDGVEIPLLFHLGAGPSVVNAEFLDHVDFYPGGFGARYGRAVGGAIDVSSRRGSADTFHGVAKIDLQDSSLFFEAPLGEGVSISAAARRSYLDAVLGVVLPLVTKPNGGTILALPVYWDYQVRLDVGPKRGESQEGKSNFSLFAFGSDDQLKVVATGVGLSRNLAVDFHTLFHRVVGTWSYKQGGVQTKLTPYFGYDLASVDLGVAKLNADTWTGGLREDFQVDATSWLTVRAGADVYLKTLIGTAEIPSLSGTQFVGFPGAEPQAQTQRIREVITSFDGALYAEADFKFGKFTVTPGVRGSSAFLNGQVRSAADPRLWVRYEPFEKTAIKGSIGLYTQPPNATNMLPSPFGTPSLTHERAFQASLGVAQKLTDAINFDVTGFYNRRFENVVSPGQTTVADDGSVTTQRFTNAGLGRAYGVEVLVRHEVTKNFFGWVAYTLSRSEERRAGTDNAYRLASFDQTHILTLVGSYRLPLGFEIGARFRYVTGRPKTPLDHQYDLLNIDSGNYAGTFGPSRSIRQPDFHQLDLRIDKYFQFEKWTLNLFLDVQNVYYAQNVEATFYDYRLRTEFNVPGIPTLPILGAKASF